MRDPDIKSETGSADPLSQDDQHAPAAPDDDIDDLAIADLVFNVVASALDL